MFKVENVINLLINVLNRYVVLGVFRGFGIVRVVVGWGILEGIDVCIRGFEYVFLRVRMYDYRDYV